MLRPLTVAFAATLLAGGAQAGSRFTADPYPSTYQPIAAGPVLCCGRSPATAAG